MRTNGQLENGDEKREIELTFYSSCRGFSKDRGNFQAFVQFKKRLRTFADTNVNRRKRIVIELNFEVKH